MTATTSPEQLVTAESMTIRRPTPDRSVIQASPRGHSQGHRGTDTVPGTGPPAARMAMGSVRPPASSPHECLRASSETEVGQPQVGGVLVWGQRVRGAQEPPEGLRKAFSPGGRKGAMGPEVDGTETRFGADSQEEHGCLPYIQSPVAFLGHFSWGQLGSGDWDFPAPSHQPPTLTGSSRPFSPQRPLPRSLPTRVARLHAAGLFTPGLQRTRGGQDRAPPPSVAPGPHSARQTLRSTPPPCPSPRTSPTPVQPPHCWEEIFPGLLWPPPPQE